MNRLWSLTTLIGLSLTAVVLVSCSKNDGNLTPPISAIPPQTCVGNQCYNYYGQPYQYPANTQIQFTARKLDANYNNYGYYQLGSLTIQSGFRVMLREAMGVCDRQDISGGQAACDAWMNGSAEISFQLDSATASGVRLMIKATPAQNYWNYWYSMPNIGDFLLGWFTGINLSNPQGFYNPMILNGTIWPTNNSKGFEIRATGPTGSWGWNKTLQFQVASGKVQDGNFTFLLYYNAYLAATGTMQNCKVNGYNYCTFL